MRGYRYIT